MSGAIARYTEAARPVKLSWAWAFWLAYAFLSMIDFWWWEFRLVDILEERGGELLGAREGGVGENEYACP